MYQWLRTLLPAILLLSLYTPLSAQTTRGQIEFSGNYGLVSGTQIILSLPAGKGIYIYKKAATPDYFADVRYYLSKGLALGITAGMQHVSFEYDNYGSAAVPDYTLTGNIITVAGEIKGSYLHSRWVQLYGLFGLGVRLFPVSSYVPHGYAPLPVFFNTQWTPFGLRIGNTFGGFAEVGVGYKGLLNMGLSYRISPARKIQVPQ